MRFAQGIIKLALLVGLVVLGIVFVPDDFMSQVKRKTDAAGSYLQGELAKRAPGLMVEFNRKAQETKRDALNLYQAAREDYLPSFWKWFYGIFWPTPAAPK